MGRPCSDGNDWPFSDLVVASNLRSLISYDSGLRYDPVRHLDFARAATEPARQAVARTSISVRLLLDCKVTCMSLHCGAGSFGWCACLCSAVQGAARIAHPRSGKCLCELRSTQSGIVASLRKTDNPAQKLHRRNRLNQIDSFSLLLHARSMYRVPVNERASDVVPGMTRRRTHH